METQVYLFCPTPGSYCLRVGTELTPLQFQKTGRYDWVVCIARLEGGETVRVTQGDEVVAEGRVAQAGGGYAVYQQELLRLDPSPSRVLLVTDMDETLISAHSLGKEAMKRFFQYWIRKHLFSGSKLVYSTGRTLYRYQCVYVEHVGVILPDLVVTGIGGEAYAIDSATGTHMRLEEFYKPELFEGWDSDLVAKVVQERYPFITKKPYPGEDCPLSLLREISPADADSHFSEIERYMSNPDSEDRGGKVLKVRTLLSGDRHRNLFVDFLPIHGGKRTAVEFAEERFGFAPEHTFVAGDSGNDVDSFSGPEIGVMPANSEPALLAHVLSSPWANSKYRSQKWYADALIEVLERGRAEAPN